LADFRKEKCLNDRLLTETVYHFKKRVYEYARERRAKSLPDEVSIKDSSKVLEIGCGARFTYRVDREVEVYGLDIVPDMIHFLKKRHPASCGIVGSALHLPFKDDSFNLLVANALLHHLVGKSPSDCIENIRVALEEMNRVVKRNGFVLVRELISRSRVFSYFMFYVTYICAKLGIEINWLDIHDKVIVFFMDKRTFNELSLKAKFKVKEVESEKWVFRFGRFGIKLGEQITFLLTPKHHT